MVHANLVALWHFDESERTLAMNGVAEGRPLEVHGAVFEPRRFGAALALRRPYDYARGPAMGAMRAGTVCCWLRLDGRPQATEILNIQGALSIMVDASADIGLVAQLGEHILPSRQQLEPGTWHYVAISFSPDGAVLYLDGEAVASEVKAGHGLLPGLNRDEYLFIGALGDQFTPFAIDELAIFSQSLDKRRIRQLALGELESPHPVKVGFQPRTIDAREYIDRSDLTCGLQKAIDAVGDAGGVVRITAGRYSLRRPLMLSSGVTLIGEGGQTVLMGPPPKSSVLSAHCLQGHTVLRVDDPAMFTPGEAVLVRSDTRTNWQATHAIVNRIDSSAVHLSRPLAADYHTFDGAVLVNWFPLIHALRRHDVHLINLVIEGILPFGMEAPGGQTIEDISEPVTATCSAIHLLDCVDCSITNCSVRGWTHDGIGIHGGARLRVTNCTAIDCLGHGLHLGGEARLTQWTGNLAERNRMDGMHIADTAQDSIISASIFTGNGHYGVGGVDQLVEKTVLVQGNYCLDNRLGGIAATTGDHLIANLSRASAGPRKISRRMFDR